MLPRCSDHRAAYTQLFKRVEGVILISGIFDAEQAVGDIVGN